MHDRSDFAGVRFLAREEQAPAGGHVESYVLDASDGEGKRAISIKTSILALARAPRVAIAEVIAIAYERSGHTVVERQIPYSEARFGRNVLHAEAAGCILRTDRAKGELETGNRRVAWDLALAPSAAASALFPHAWMYSDAFPGPKIASPVPSVRLQGRVSVDGNEWNVERWEGAIGHRWGRRRPERFARARVAQWDEGRRDELLIEAASFRPGLPLSPPMTILMIRYCDVVYRLNGLLEITKNRAEVSLRRFRFEGGDSQITIRGEVWAETDDMVGLCLESPSGPPAHALETNVARARVELRVRGGAPRVYHSRAASLELGASDAHHGVRTYS